MPHRRSRASRSRRLRRWRFLKAALETAVYDRERCELVLPAPVSPFVQGEVLVSSRYVNPLLAGGLGDGEGG